MSRSLSTEMLAVSTAELVRPVIFVDLHFDTADGGSLYLWSGMGQLSHDGNTYVGAGDLLSVSDIQENTELSANGMSITLSGVGEPLISKARDSDYQGRLLEVKLGALDESGDVISDPVVLFSGFMDVMSISSSGDTATISVSVENRLIEFDRTRVRRNTAEDQKIDYPTDKAFEYVSQIQEKEIVWGNKKANPASYTGSRDDTTIQIPSFRF